MGKPNTPNRVKRAAKRTAIPEAALDQVFEAQQVVATLAKGPDWKKFNDAHFKDEFPEATPRPILVTLVVEYEDFASLADGAAELHDEAKHFGDLVSMKVSIPGGDYDWKA